MQVNTTRGPVEVDPTYRYVNTSRITEEDMSFEDEEPEILSVLPGTGWQAVVEGNEPRFAAPRRDGAPATSQGFATADHPARRKA
jgi:hypothetical protein